MEQVHPMASPDRFEMDESTAALTKSKRGAAHRTQVLLSDKCSMCVFIYIYIRACTIMMLVEYLHSERPDVTLIYN